MANVEVIPAVIPDSLETVKEKFGQVLGLAKEVQIDFVDGVYAPVTSWPWGENNEEQFSKIFLGEEKFPFIDEFIMEADLLVNDPEKIIDKLVSIGFKSFVIHIDSTNNVYDCIDLAKKMGGQAGLGIKPSIDSVLLEQFLNKCDFVQFMGNDQVGYNGVELDRKVLDKIKNFHTLHPKIPLQIDIGVNFQTAPEIVEAGATRLISGSAIFESDIGAAEAIKKLQN